MNKFPDLPPVWAAFMGLLAWGFASALPLARMDVPLVVPLLIVAIAVAIELWSSSFFLRARTPIMPRNKPRALLVQGPYRLTRNPIYLAMLMLLLAWAVYLGAVTAFLPVLAFPVLITRRFIAGEEAGLRAAFGAEAEAYLARTPRWLFW